MCRGGLAGAQVRERGDRMGVEKVTGIDEHSLVTILLERAQSLYHRCICGSGINRQIFLKCFRGDRQWVIVRGYVHSGS